MNVCAALLAAAVVIPGAATAQPAAHPPPPPTAEASPGERAVTVGEVASFLAGGALGLGIHESGHLLSVALFDADPGVKRVHFGPLPFFAITHADVSPAREYTIAASGFWMQHLSSEWLLATRPGLRYARAPVAKGVLAFNVAASVAYASAAFGRFGPAERDTRAMAASLDIAEPWVGAMILAPAALDAWRYFRPGSRWAVWASRAMKAGAVLVVIRAARSSPGG